jgi:chemotaxis protein methyltransferase CheR
MSVQEAPELDDHQVERLVETLYRDHGFDFREYARPSLKRRIWNAVRKEGLDSVAELERRVLTDGPALQRLQLALSVNVTSMFRDPEFFRVFRERVAPALRTYPFLRIWHAGCSTGEEVYSMAMLLQEEGLYDRCRIYATDMNETVLRQARDGIYPLKQVEQYGENYRLAGGTGSLEDYYTAGYGNAIFRASLRDNVIFSQHNLATDSSFNEFHVILCRNVMIYFRRPLQERVHHLFHESLVMFGILALGSKETLQFTPYERQYAQLVPGFKVFRRVG